MPQFHVKAPNGKTYAVTAPEGATQDDALKYVQQNLGQLTATPSASSPQTAVPASILPPQLATPNPEAAKPSMLEDFGAKALDFAKHRLQHPVEAMKEDIGTAVGALNPVSLYNTAKAMVTQPKATFKSELAQATQAYHTLKDSGAATPEQLDQSAFLLLQLLAAPLLLRVPFRLSPKELPLKAPFKETNGPQVGNKPTITLELNQPSVAADRAILDKAGLQYKQVEGMWQGKASPSYVVQVHKPEDFAQVMDLASKHGNEGRGQDAVLVTSPQGDSSLVKPHDLSPIAQLGPIKEIPESLASKLEAYTKDPETGKLYAAVPPGEDMLGVHYSQKPRTELNGSKYGTGMKGAERKRLDNLEPDDLLRKRVYAYVDQGQGIRPESGVGRHPHLIHMKNLYNLEEDALGLKKTAKNANDMEHAILQAGYDGYWTPRGTQASAVLLGKASEKVPVLTEADAGMMLEEQGQAQAPVIAELGAKAATDATGALKAGLLAKTVANVNKGASGVLLREMQDSWDSLKRAVVPENFGPKAKQLDSLIPERLANLRHQDFIHYTAGLGRKTYIAKLPPQERLDLLKSFESGKKTGDQVLDAYVPFYRDWFRKQYEQDQALGIEYEARDNYLPHIWAEPDRFQNWLNRRYGDKWRNPSFMKERVFNVIQEGLDAGFELKTDNLEEIAQQRQHMSDLAQMRIETLQQMEQEGLAREVSGPTAGRKFEETRRAPNGKYYALPREIMPLYQNALESPSIWSQRNLGGAAFRSGMWLKNTFVPIQLSLSLFHPLHVIGIDSSARTVAAFQKGNVGEALHALAQPALWDWSSNGPYRSGSRAVAAYHNPTTKLSKLDAQNLQYMKDGGFVPALDEVYKKKALDNFRDAIEQGDYLSAIPAAAKAPFQLLQYPIFEKWIPALKASSYLNDTYAAIAKDPTLLEDAVKRRTVFRQIAKSVDNRYGEMQYNTLFWQRWLRDIGVGTTLSLGWNLGFVREFGGAGLDTIRTPLRLKKGGPAATNKMLFAATYTAQALAFGGLVNWALTGQAPQELKDYVYPRTGGVNPDGTPGRVNTMYYTREYGAMYYHAKQEGAWTGLVHMAGNKLAPPLVDVYYLYRNRDYFNNEIADPNSPAFKQLLQKTEWVTKQILPISLRGPMESGNATPKDYGLGILGLTPAPGYARETAIEGKIYGVYKKYHQDVTPYDQVEYHNDLRDMRKMLRSGNTKDLATKLREVQSRHRVPPGTVARMFRELSAPPGANAFKQLSTGQQTKLLEDMTPDEAGQYEKYAHPEVRMQFYRKWKSKK